MQQGRYTIGVAIVVAAMVILAILILA